MRQFGALTTEPLISFIQCIQKLEAISAFGAISTLQQWETVSTLGLYAILNIPTFCNMSTVEMAALNATNALLTTLGSDNAGNLIKCNVVYLHPNIKVYLTNKYNNNIDCLQYKNRFEIEIQRVKCVYEGLYTYNEGLYVYMTVYMCI